MPAPRMTTVLPAPWLDDICGGPAKACGTRSRPMATIVSYTAAAPPTRPTASRNPRRVQFGAFELLESLITTSALTDTDTDRNLLLGRCAVQGELLLRRVHCWRFCAFVGARQARFSAFLAGGRCHEGLRGSGSCTRRPRGIRGGSGRSGGG